MMREHRTTTRERLGEHCTRASSTPASSRSKSASGHAVVRADSGIVDQEIGVNLRDMMPGMFQGRTRTRECPCPKRSSI